MKGHQEVTFALDVCGAEAREGQGAGVWAAGRRGCGGKRSQAEVEKTLTKTTTKIEKKRRVKKEKKEKRKTYRSDESKMVKIIKESE